MFLRQHPTYKERLLSCDQKAKLSRTGEVRAFFLFVLYHMLCIPASVFLRMLNYPLYKNIDDNFLKYRAAFGYWSIVGNLHKAQESLFYKSISVKDPSLEIGLCRGDISSLFFGTKEFTCGSEFLYFTGAKAYRNYKLWKWVISEDLYNLAWKDDTFRTICLVHTIDHIKNLDSTLSELSRIVKDGGVLYMSGYSAYLFKPNIIHFILRNFNKSLAERFAESILKKRHHYNLLSYEEWNEKLQQNGFEIVDFKYFDGGKYEWFVYFMFHVLETGRCFEFKLFKIVSKFIFMEKLFCFYYISIGYPIYCMVRNNKVKWGTDFFLKAAKITGNKNK